ncbi:hypothetical protein NUU61_007633 [Penicillium alfredii]|uniref:Pentacotripeptide-repeat region of PRORP domain-containing protein n=1 Tax=Penicillium alfredii TaxID=1506179 RepID=A0A9W9JYR3_9EURO|nr:uncharacterized protein NUU61_007633 [Penicillium alfredii]KAJ5086326.1 hypothetical protein NUU61_007633 [Penicillium alfredii]
MRCRRNAEIQIVIREPGMVDHGPTSPSRQGFNRSSFESPVATQQTSRRRPQNADTRQQSNRSQASQGNGEKSISYTPLRSRSGRPRKPNTPLLSKTKVRKIILSQGLAPNLAHYASRRINGEIRSQNRYFNRRSVYLATVIRLNSIYSRELGLRQWKAAYASIYKAKAYQREVQNKAALPALKDKGLALLEEIRADCQGRFRESWEKMARPMRASIWQRLAIWLLQNEPELTLEFLLVTTSGQEKPDFSMVAECLLYLDRFHYEDRLQNWQSGTHTYQSAIESCLHPKDWPILSLPQKGVRLYIRRSSHEGISLALRIAMERSTELSAETALCFMYRFTELRDVERALKALEYIPRLKEPGFTMQSEGVLRHCCKLLTLDTVQDTAGGRNFRILPRLLTMGVRPDRDMMNVVLSNSFKTGDPQLGADMLQFMKRHGHVLDSYTYLTLLTDAVSRGDRGRVDSLVQEVDSQAELRENPYIASKIFHAHYVFTAKHMDTDADARGVFYSMLDMYNRFHDLTPLKELLIVPSNYTPPVSKNNTPPSPVALYIMIATYFRCQKNFSNVQRIYIKFRELVLQGHPSIAPLAETDHTYNEFLIAFRSNPRGMRSSVRLVEDMLSSSANIPSGSSVVHAKPTVRTWTILLSAFTFHKHPLAAEKIKQMMAKYNMEYNDVTWNIIVNGYANAQNIPETASAIKAMEQHGFAIDPYTMKSLRYLRDPERLWVAIDEMDQKHPETARQQATSLPQSAPESVVRNDQKNRDQLVDLGLQRMEKNIKPKL